MTKNYRNIIVPLDGSHNSKLAFRRALSLAEQHPAKLHLVHIINELTNFAGADAKFVHHITDVDVKLLKKHQQEAAKHNVKADCKVDYGSPKVMIAHNLVDYYHPDLIVMGANGLTKVERVLLGSVAAYVSRVAPCDVLLVKEKH